MDILQIEGLKKQNAMLRELNQRLLVENKRLKNEMGYLQYKGFVIKTGSDNIIEELNTIYNSKGWKMLELLRRIKYDLKMRIMELLHIDKHNREK